MKKIAIKTREKFFMKHFISGFIRTEILNYFYDIEKDEYTIRFLDTCYDVKNEKQLVIGSVTNENPTVIDVEKEIVLGTEIRVKKYSSAKLHEMISILNIEQQNFNNITDYINEILKQSLLTLTKQECDSGASGTTGLGIYLTPKETWDFV